METTGVLYATKTAFEVTYTPDIVYARRKTRDLKLQLLTPAAPNIQKEHHHPLYEQMAKQFPARRPAPAPENRRFPLIVDIPGSGWSGAEGYAHVPHMVELAKRGYVVACIGYRGTFQDDVRFPAAAEDAKEAIRFLRAHADEYLVDVNRVAVLGDSSGGHTAAMVAFTGDESRYQIGECRQQSDAVRSCVLFYAPNDLLRLVPDRIAEKKTLRPGEGEFPFEAREIFQDDFLKDPEGMLRDASPISHISAGRAIPPVLFLQGDQDPIIPLAQGLRLCEAVRSAGGRAEFYKIIGARHGTGCWTPEAIQLVADFLAATL